MTAIAPHMTAYLRQRLPVERVASQHTCDTYAYAFQILLDFASHKLGVLPSTLQLEHLDAPLVLEFLEHLQSTRGNAPRTRNARLTAIKSFMHFVEHRVPGALEQISRVLAIPNQRTDRPLVDHLTAEQCKAILDCPEPTTRLGIRDRAMLHLSVTAGLRVSELVGLRLDDVAFESRYLNLHVRGKGRKNRLLTLWKAVAESVRAWLAVRGAAMVPELFRNARGKEMTRAGFEYLLLKHATAASANERLTLNRAGQVVLTLKTPYRDGTTHIVMSPLEFMQRLAALVPRPRLHLIRFHGVLAPNARLRPEIIPTVPVNAHTPSADHAEAPPAAAPAPLSWARLLQRVFDIDLEHCPRCGGPLKIIAAIEHPPVIAKILAHLGLPARAPPRSPARAFP